MLVIMTNAPGILSGGSILQVGDKLFRDHMVVRKHIRISEGQRNDSRPMIFLAIILGPEGWFVWEKSSVLFLGWESHGRSHRVLTGRNKCFGITYRQQEKSLTDIEWETLVRKRAIWRWVVRGGIPRPWQCPWQCSCAILLRNSKDKCYSSSF